jgi:hypothetical protein
VPTESKPRNWLSEADVDFFVGSGGSSEAERASSSPSSAEDDAVVSRRLTIGAALSAAAAAFALVPTQRLRAPPSKPLFLYLVPLMRVQKLLEEAEKIIPDGDYGRLRAILDRIEGEPNNVQDNLRDAAACEFAPFFLSYLLSI